MLQSKQEIFSGKVIRVTVETVRLPNGYVAELEIVHHPGGAAVVAIDSQQRVCLLRQYRHAAGGYLWELPAGKLEPSEPPASTAARELIEEAGQQAARWQSLGQYVSSPGVFTEIVHVFLARGLTTVAPAPEAAEVLEVHWVPLSDALRRAALGEIVDGKTVLGLWRAQVHLQDEGAEVRYTG